MGLRAFISDIHANAEALCRVCDDIRRQNADQIVCLGDIVGYGPDPEACTDFIMEKTTISLMGNHDDALLHGPTNFNPIAAEVIQITRERMDPQVKPKGLIFRHEHPFSCKRHDPSRPRCTVGHHERGERWKYIENLEKSHVEGRLLYVHASPLDPVSEYVFPDRFERWWNRERLTRMFGVIDWCAFFGHTHMPCVITDDLTCLYPEQNDYRLTLDPARKYLINVGSVGQPRDGDPRACYLLFDEEKREIQWRRVEYDLDTVVKRIERMCGKDNWCGVRLRLGR